MRTLFVTSIGILVTAYASGCATSPPSMRSEPVAVTSSGSAPHSEPTATRLPRRDTQAKLLCSAAESEAQIAHRNANGICRTHAQQYSDAKPYPQNPNNGIRALSGR